MADSVEDSDRYFPDLICYEYTIEWYRSVYSNTDNWTDFSTTYGGETIFVSLLRCGSSIFSDIASHAAVCFPKILRLVETIEEQQEGNKSDGAGSFISPGIDLFEQTLYGDALRLWDKEFPSTTRSKSSASFTRSLKVFLGAHPMLADIVLNSYSMERRLNVVAAKILDYMTSDRSKFRKDRTIPVREMVWSVQHMAAVYRVLESDSYEMEGVDVEKALALTLPDCWFCPYFDIPRAVKYPANDYSNLAVLISYYQTMEREYATKTKEYQKGRHEQRSQDRKRRKQASDSKCDGATSSTIFTVSNNESKSQSQSLSATEEDRSSIFDTLALKKKPQKGKQATTKKSSSQSKVGLLESKSYVDHGSDKPKGIPKQPPPLKNKPGPSDDLASFTNDRLIHMANWSLKQSMSAINEAWDLCKESAVRRKGSIHEVVLRFVFTYACCTNKNGSLQHDNGKMDVLFVPHRQYRRNLLLRTNTQETTKFKGIPPLIFRSMLVLVVHKWHNKSVCFEQIDEDSLRMDTMTAMDLSSSSSDTTLVVVTTKYEAFYPVLILLQAHQREVLIFDPLSTRDIRSWRPTVIRCLRKLRLLDDEKKIQSFLSVDIKEELVGCDWRFIYKKYPNPVAPSACTLPQVSIICVIDEILSKASPNMSCDQMMGKWAQELPSCRRECHKACNHIVSTAINKAKRDSTLRVCFKDVNDDTRPRIKRSRRFIMEGKDRGEVMEDMLDSDDERFEDIKVIQEITEADKALERLHEDRRFLDLVRTLNDEDQKEALCSTCGTSLLKKDLDRSRTFSIVSWTRQETSNCPHYHCPTCTFIRNSVKNRFCSICGHSHAELIPHDLHETELIAKKDKTIVLDEYDEDSEQYCAICHGQRPNDCRIERCGHKFCRVCLGHVLTTEKQVPMGKQKSTPPEMNESCPLCNGDIASITYTNAHDGSVEEVGVSKDEHRGLYRPVPVFPETAWGRVPLETLRFMSKKQQKEKNRRDQTESSTVTISNTEAKRQV